MNHKTLLTLLAMAFLTDGGQAASLLTLSDQASETLSASGMDIALPREAHLTIEGQRTKLTATGNGIRVKKVLLFQANVYALQSFISQDDEKALAGAAGLEDRVKLIQGAKDKALRLTFLRDVSPDKIKSAFEQALENNGIDPQAEHIKKFTDLLTDEFKQKSVVTLIAHEEKGKTTLYVELPNKKITIEGKQAVSDLWKIWFGKPVDDQMRVLQLRLSGIQDIS